MANTNLHGEDLIRHCGLNDEGKAVMMEPHDLHRLIGTFTNINLQYTKTGMFDIQNANI